MNRKNNPWVSLIALILVLAGVLVLVCTGCGNTTTAEAAENPRFVWEEAGFSILNYYAYIITDTETGVQYLLVRHLDQVGLTVLQPAETAEE